MTRRLAGNALVFLGYSAIGFAYFGARLVSHPGRGLVGYGRDPDIFVWSFGWWLHALETLQNPLYSRAIYAPVGINLAWATTVPGLALAFTPITAVFGPDVSYNLAAMLLPALAAFTAYLLCRRITHSLWASLVGGYLFGFSSYMLGQTQGHMHMTAVFLVPLIALATFRYLRGELDGKGVAWRLGVLFGLQFWLGTEVLFTSALVLALALVLSFALVRSTRPRIRGLLLPLLGAIGLALLIAGPIVYYALTGFQSESINQPSVYDGDILNFLVPTQFIWAGGQWFLSTSVHFRGNDSEAGAYLGIPTLVIIAWYALAVRRSVVARYLLAVLALVVVLTLGTGFVYRGRIEFWLPWRELSRLPAFNNVLPSRFAMFAALTAAVIVAVWTSSRRGWPRWVLPALAVAALVPDLSRAYYVVHPERWSFFTDHIYKICFPKNQNVAIFPFGFHGDSTLWQAESGFYFRQPGGYLAPNPPKADIDNDPLIQVETYSYGKPTTGQFLAFLHREKVDRIISVIVYQRPTAVQMRRFGSLQVVGGVYVTPGCSYPSIQKGIHPTPPHPKS